MDQKLVAWARAVKRRHRMTLPPLWLFTDPVRTPDPVAAVAGLPPGLCGVVLRGAPDQDPAAHALMVRTLARLCRSRRLVLSVAGGPALRRQGPAGVLRHLREGRGRAVGGTSSAHGVAGLVRARRAGCAAAFLSPVFATASHPGAPWLGPWRWARMAVQLGAGGMAVLALGGIDGRTVRGLPRFVAGVGAISALMGGPAYPLWRIRHSVSS